MEHRTRVAVWSVADFRPCLPRPAQSGEVRRAVADGILSLAGAVDHEGPRQ
jgi:hypothetical protein